MAKPSSAKYTILSYLFLVLSLVLSVSWSFRIFISLLIISAIVFNKRASALFVIKFHMLCLSVMSTVKTSSKYFCEFIKKSLYLQSLYTKELRCHFSLVGRASHS